MKNRYISCFLAAALVTLTLFTAPSYGQQGLRLSTDNMSFFEEPLAYDVGGVTVLLNALFDLSNTRDLDTDKDDGKFSAIGQLSAEKQLKNALTVGATYRGEEEDGYDDQVAAYVRGVWGSFSIGDVTENTEIVTERMDGVGNANMMLDNFYGSLSDQGAAYSGRFSAFTLNGVIDEDNNFDLGVTFERPLGNKDYRFTGRALDSVFIAASGVTLDSSGVILTGELIYGSLLTDLSIGFETLKSDAYTVERQYIAAGIAYKRNRWSFSLEGLAGDIEGESESSWSAGLRYDIARGLSANLGVNHTDSLITIDGVRLNEDDNREAIVSLRYEF